MAASRLAVLAHQAILPGCDETCSVSIEVDLDTGLITAVKPLGGNSGKSDYSGWEILELDKEQVLLPGLVDTHVHLNQPGRTPWEGFQTGTLAAISGGVSLLVDMPLNSIPPTTTVANLHAKQAEARAVGVNTDVAFWGGLIPGNHGDLKPLLEAGVKGFKCFLINSGVDEFPHVEESDLVKACDALSGTNALILFHAELEGPGHLHPDSVPADRSDYATFLDSRPPALELSALDLILRFARRYPHLRFHIVHLSAASAIPIIKEARASGMTNLTVETCFHYLCLRAEDIPRDATQFKCCPPIRDEQNRQAICAAVLDGTIDFVVSDHSPCVPELKQGDFMSAWGGISALGLGLSLVWTQLGSQAGLARICRWLGSRQAEQVGLGGQKSVIAVGADADFVIFDPNASFVVTNESLHYRNKISPYLGKTLYGVVRKTYLRGRLAWDGKAVVSDAERRLF